MKKFIFVTILMLVLPVSLFAGDSESILPPVKMDETRLSSVSEVFVNTFVFEGNTVFSDTEIADVVKDYVGKRITAEQLQEAKNKITQHYITHGYVNSGAIIPDQKVEGGTILIRVIEGRLTEIQISGNTWLRDRYIRKRLELATSGGKKPINITTLQERLKILKQDPRIENVNAEMGPGIELGEAVLNVTVEEARPYHLDLHFNNYNSPSIGSYRGEIGAEHINITGWGDSIRGQYGLTEGLDDYSVTYSVPITRWDTTLSFSTDRTTSDVVAEPFDRLDIKSETTTYGGGIRHPFYKSVASEFAMGLKFENRKSETFLLGEPFSFSPGVQNGESELSVLRFYQEWVNRSLNQVFALRSSFNFGVDWLDPTINDAGPDSRFFTWLGQVQWIRRLDFCSSQILANMNLQFSDDPLLPAEKFAVGGHSSVRGYRENQMTTDSGLIGSLEWRIPIFTLKIPKISTDPNDGVIQLATFFDYGTGWNKDEEDPKPSSLYSVGLGLRYLISKMFQLELYWGQSLRDVPKPSEYNLQDDGIHFQVSAFLF